MSAVLLPEARTLAGSAFSFVGASPALSGESLSGRGASPVHCVQRLYSAQWLLAHQLTTRCTHCDMSLCGHHAVLTSSSSSELVIGY
jgi:hypothetical protein